MAALDGADGGASCARRRRERSLRAFWKHKLLVSGAPSRRRRTTPPTRLGASTPRPRREPIQQRAVEQIVHSLMQQVNIPQERTFERIMEQTVDVPVPHETKGTEIVYMAPAPAVARRRRTAKSVAPAPATTHAAPDPATEYAAPSPAGTRTAPAPVIECSSPAAAYAAPAPVNEYVTSSPTGTCAAPASDRICGIRACRYLHGA